MHPCHLGWSRGNSCLGNSGGKNEEDCGDHQAVLLGHDCLCHHHVLPPPPPGRWCLHPRLCWISWPLCHRSVSFGSGGCCGGHLPSRPSHSDLFHLLLVLSSRSVPDDHRELVGISSTC